MDQRHEEDRGLDAGAYLGARLGGRYRLEKILPRGCAARRLDGVSFFNAGDQPKVHVCFTKAVTWTVTDLPAAEVTGPRVRGSATDPRRARRCR